MLKVLMLTRTAQNYRIATFNEMSKSIDLTLGYTEQDKMTSQCLFKKIKLNAKKIGPFIICRGLNKITKQFDVVIFSADMHSLSYCFLPYLPHKNKIVSWCIGFRVSYTKPYLVNRKHTLLDKLYGKLLRKCDSNIFYMECAKNFWDNKELPHNRIFVAPNSTSVLDIDIIPDKKKDFIFVGTLYKSKGIEKLLNSFSEVCKVHPNAILHVVGGGRERESIEEYIQNNNLDNNVILYGPIYDEEKLSELFSKSVLSISPNQAGLSVIKSMGYGVPFVTRTDAITGGEIFHIENNITGITYKNDNDLTPILIDAINNPLKYHEMGFKARDYYINKGSVKHMAEGALNAIEYALNK